MLRKHFLALLWAGKMASNGTPLVVKELAPKRARPNYSVIHANPLPLKTFPLPTFIPHNPLSILYVACTYLRQILLRPSSHPKDLLVGHFVPEIGSVHITDEKTIRVLWESGFFGKGSLSRSEPTWLQREKRKRGWAVGDTSEDVTKMRREERNLLKQERALKEQEAIERTRKGESGVISSTETVNESRDPAQDESSAASDVNTVEVEDRGQLEASPSRNLSVEALESVDEAIPESPGPEENREEIPNQEHFQLTAEEAFFLVYALDVLEIRAAGTGSLIQTKDLFHLFAAHSTFPPLELPLCSPALPDNGFLVSYVAYHHFRSLGWVVKSGVKFGVDLLLYKGGPVFSHAEFAVAVLPAYTDNFWSSRPNERKTQKPWHWLHMVNRVQALAKKTLVLCYVEIPPPEDARKNEPFDIGKLLSKYKVREFIIRRWTLNHQRD